MHLENKLVYIVDDEDDLQSILSDIICGWGYQVKCFSDMNSVLAQAQIDMPQFLITDLSLPNGSGLDLIRLLRKVNAALPVLLMTGRDLSDVYCKIQGDPKVQLIQKPFDMSRILEFLQLPA